MLSHICLKSRPFRKKRLAYELRCFDFAESICYTGRYECDWLAIETNMPHIAALRALRIAPWAHLGPLCSLNKAQALFDAGSRIMRPADRRSPEGAPRTGIAHISCPAEENQLKWPANAINSANPISSVLPLGCSKNRKWPKNEPLEILASGKFAFVCRIMTT